MGRPPADRQLTPRVQEWRAAGLAQYRILTEVVGSWQETDPLVLRARVDEARRLDEPLLIRAGLIADGDRL